MTFRHELRRNAFILLKAGTVVTVLDPRPDGQTYEMTLTEDKQLYFGSTTPGLIDETTFHQFKQQKNT